MHCTNLVVVGLVSLVCTIATTQAKGKPALAQRLYTTKQGACTAVCKDNLMEDCDVTCAPTPTRGPQAPAGLHKRGVVTVTNNGCTAVCWDLSPGTECDVHCSGGFATTLAPTPTSIAITSTVTSTTTASRKTFSEDGCTAVCWDMQPAGTECDLQCKESLPTKMPGNVAHLCGANISHHLKSYNSSLHLCLFLPELIICSQMFGRSI